MKLPVKNLEEFIPQVLIPSEKVYEMRNGKKRIQRTKFFPGLCLSFRRSDLWRSYHVVNSIPGVIGFLGNNSVRNIQNSCCLTAI